MVDISVIIPVYNVEKYLRKCLSSVINQSFKNIEIICVNDGSSDNSLRILSEYEHLDDRILLISQSNKGLGSARNKGIEYSKGKYLFFLDSDDYIELNTLEELFNHAEKTDADLVLFKAINYNSDEGKFFETRIYNMKNVSKVIGDGTVNYKDLGNLIFSISVTAWIKLYKRDLIELNNIRFPEDLIFEDNLFNWEVILASEKIAFYPKHFYIRRRHSNSITALMDQRFIDSIKINRLVIEIFKKNNVFEEFKKELYNRRISLTYMRFCEIMSEFKEPYFEKLKEDYEKIVVDDFYNDYIETLNNRNKAIFEACLNASNSREFMSKLNQLFQDS